MCPTALVPDLLYSLQLISTQQDGPKTRNLLFEKYIFEFSYKIAKKIFTIQLKCSLESVSPPERLDFAAYKCGLCDQTGI